MDVGVTDDLTSAGVSWKIRATNSTNYISVDVGLSGMDDHLHSAGPFWEFCSSSSPSAGVLTLTIANGFITLDTIVLKFVVAGFSLLLAIKAASGGLPM